MGGDLKDIGEIVADMVHRCTVERMTGWEEILRLHIKPKPNWIPESFWQAMVKMVVIQSHQKKRPTSEAEG